VARAERKTSSPSNSAVIEPVGADLVALAQAHALDATTFPHQSLPPVFGGDAPPTVWVARLAHGSPVVGFIATRATRGALDIAGLAVDAAHRRLGIARALLRAAVRSARSRGLDTVELHVSTANDAALALYESERFRMAARIPAFYSSGRFPDGGDAWIMIRDLS
jgi:ribosomal protein S18 acetylase RimI-like enzyme